MTVHRDFRDVHGDGHPVSSLRWTGEIDLTRVPELRDEILALRTDQPVYLDLSEVSYLDSSGLGMLVLLRKRLARCGSAVTLVAVPPHARRILEITGLDRVFLFVPRGEHDPVLEPQPE